MLIDSLSRRPAERRQALSGLGATMLVLFAGFVGMASVGIFESANPPLHLVVAGGLTLVALVALSLTRFDLVVAIAVLLLGFVRFEPAPVDLAFAVLISVSFVTGRLDLRQVPLSIFGLLGTIVVITMVSAVNAIDPVRALTYFLITLYLVLLAFWLTSYVRSFERMRLIVRAYIASAVIVTIPAIAALFVAFPGSNLLLYGHERSQGFFKDPNVFGPFLVTAILVVVGELLSPRLLSSGRLRKATIGFVLTAGVFFSYSRAAWLSLVVGLLAMLPVIAFRRHGGRQAAALIGAAVLATIGIAAVVTASGSESFLRERAQFQTYDVERFGAQASGAQLAREYPLGIGPGQFERVSEVSAHSSYVRALAEQGVLGAAALIALMLSTLILALRNAVTGRSTYGLGSATLFGAWCGLLVNSAFVDTLHWRHLWVVAALIWIGATQPTRAGSV